MHVADCVRLSQAARKFLVRDRLGHVALHPWVIAFIIDVMPKAWKRGQTKSVALVKCACERRNQMVDRRIHHQVCGRD